MTSSAYIAGIIDGEGCIRWDKTHGLRIRIAMDDEEPIKETADFFGLKYMKWYDKKRKKNQYIFECYSRIAMNVLKIIHSNLLNKRQLAEELIIKFEKNHPENKRLERLLIDIPVMNLTIR